MKIKLTTIILCAYLNVKISTFTQALKSDVELPRVNGRIKMYHVRIWGHSAD